MLDPDELKRRLDAFRTLRGMKQTDLAEKLKEDGHGKHDLGRLERGDKRMPLTPSLRRSLAHHLRVPEDWLVVENLDDALTPTVAPDTERYEQLMEQVQQMRQEREQAAAVIQRLLREQHELLATIRNLTARLTQPEHLAQIARDAAALDASPGDPQPAPRGPS